MDKPPKDTAPDPAIDDTNVVPIRAPNKGQFVKGQSGNASGKASPTSRRSVKAATDALYARRAGKVAKILWQMIEDENTPPTVRFNAVKEWNDRGLGKAKQEIAVTNTEVQSNIDTAALSDETLRDIMAASKANKGKK